MNITDSNGCFASETYNLPSSTPLTFETITIAPSCLSPDGGSLVLANATGVFPLELTIDNTPAVLSNTINNLPSGSYLLNVMDASGCDTTLNINMPQPITPTVDISATTTELQLGESTQLIGQTNLDLQSSSIMWSPETGLSCSDCLTPIATPFQTQTYTLQATAADGCQVSASIDITVDRRVPIFIPNVFSPNADGNNDRFIVYPESGVDDIESIQIFDRWGNLVFDASNNVGWDGTIDLTPAPPGVYVYQVLVRLVDGQVKLVTGDIVLVR